MEFTYYIVRLTLFIGVWALYAIKQWLREMNARNIDLLSIFQVFFSFNLPWNSDCSNEHVENKSHPRTDRYDCVQLVFRNCWFKGGKKTLFDYVGLLFLSEVIEGICPQSEVIGGENRTEHNTANSVPYSLWLVCDLFNVPQFYERWSVVSPYPRRFERLTTCRCNYKGNTIPSVILRTRMLVRTGFEPAASRIVVRYSTKWAIGVWLC